MIYVGSDHGLLPQREKMISASRMGSLWPVRDAYDSRKRCILKMRGEYKEEPSNFVLSARAYGQHIEEEINFMYEEMTNTHVNRKCRGFTHPTEKVWGTPDGIVKDDNNKTIRLVEYKARMPKHSLPTKVKEMYYLQVQTMLYIISGLMEANIVWGDYELLPAHFVYYHEKEGMRIWEIMPDQEVFKSVPEKLAIAYRYLDCPSIIPKSTFDDDDDLNLEDHVIRVF